MDISSMSEQELQSVEKLIHLRRVAIFNLEPRFLPEDVRNEIIVILNENEEEANNTDLCNTDHSLTTDKDLLEEYEECFCYDDEDKDEDRDELLQKALGYQAEYDMLKTP